MQADPLGLVDGASVYGYVKQNPGRWIDPRGEFIPLAVVGGALAGAGASAALQAFVNMYYGNMSFREALGCIDVVPVVTGGAFGANGLGLLGLLIKGQYKSAATSAAVSGGFNKSAPNYYFDEPPCGCELPELPAWVKILKEIAFI